jgi:Flp pilus assembly protein TadD
VQRKSGDALDVTLTAAMTPDREVLLGAIYSAARDWPHAVEHLQAALDAGRDNTDVLNQLGWAHLQLGHREQAATLFGRSIAAKPEQPEIRRVLSDLRTGRQDRPR